MTQSLNPEIKALRGMVRALAPLDPEQRQRSVEWYAAQQTGRVWLNLPRFTADVVSSPQSAVESCVG